MAMGAWDQLLPLLLVAPTAETPASNPTEASGSGTGFDFAFGSRVAIGRKTLPTPCSTWGGAVAGRA